MLVLTRKVDQQIVINGNITLTINRISKNRVAVGIDAPEDVHVYRGELSETINDFVDAQLEHESEPADVATYAAA